MKSALIALVAACLLSACASNDNPPCRRVTAQEFMRRHTFKGIASDEFVGTTKGSRMGGQKRAFKTIWEMGWNHGWAVIWTPVAELPPEYLKTAREKPTWP